jgi:putative NADH-flavin reductase
VVAVARRPAALDDLRSERLRVVQSDGFDPRVAEDVVRGCDAVISGLGVRPGEAPTSVCTDGVTAMMSAMRATGVTRVVTVSASAMVVDEHDPWPLRYVAKPILQRVFRAAYADLARSEALLTASDLVWTLVRPPRLTDKPRTGTYRYVLGRNLRWASTVSRADTADAVLRALREPAWERTVVCIGD